MRADIFKIGFVAVFEFLPHDESNHQSLRGLAPMRVFALDLDQGFAKRRRVVIEIRRGGIEQRERIEARRAEAEDVERIQHHHIADRAAIVGGDGGKLALRINHDD